MLTLLPSGAILRLSKGYEIDERRQHLQGYIYEICIEGHLSTGWSTWLGEMQIRPEECRTVLYGHLVDQAALHGVLQKIRDLGLTLVSVSQLPADRS